MTNNNKLAVADGPSFLGELVLCPVIGCNFEYVHLQAVRTDKEGRGSFVEIDMWCECGHAWTLRFKFHKGQVEFSVTNSRDVDITELPEMWRD